MDLLLSLGNRRRDTGTQVRMDVGPVCLCMPRVPIHYGFFPKLYLALRQFNGQPMVLRLQSSTEVELELKGNYLDIWNNVGPTLTSLMRLHHTVLSQTGPTSRERFEICEPVTFLKPINTTLEPLITCEDLYSMAFWLPPGETVTFDCRIQSFSCGFYFTEPHAGHPTFIVGDCYSLEVSYFPYPYKKKVEEWGTPDGFRKWDYTERSW
jgi:hypothetical protein